MRSQFSRRDSAREGVDCKLINASASHQNSEASFCAVWVPYR